MNRKIFFLVILSLNFLFASANDNVVLNLGISKFTHEDNRYFPKDAFLKADLGVGYQFSFFEVGGVFSFNRCWAYYNDRLPFSTAGLKEMYSFGVYSKYFWLSHLENVKFVDSYIGAKYLRYIMSRSYDGHVTYLVDGVLMEIDILASSYTNDPGNIFDLNYGLVFFPLKKLSFFAEYGYSFYPGNKNFIKKDKLQFGINFKFQSL